MMTGIVNADLDAILRLKIQGQNGQELEIDAVIDTGFGGELTLPPDLISALGLTWLSRARAEMANGKTDTFDIYDAVVLWDGQPLLVTAEYADTEPLIGMSLLAGYKLTVEAKVGGAVEIVRL